MDIYMVYYFSIAFVLWVIYLIIDHIYSYWFKNAVPIVEPSFPYGNLKGLGKTRHISDIIKGIYATCKDKTTFCGMWFYIKPVAVGTHLDFVQDVLIKDAKNFTDKGLYGNEKDEPLSVSLLSADGESWKNSRNKVTPAYTASNLKYLFPTVVDVGKEFQKALERTVSTNSDLEITDFCTRYVIDVIGTAGFGVDCNSLKDPDNSFGVMGKRALIEKRHGQNITSLCQLYPNIAKFLGIKLLPQEVQDYFMNVVKETVVFREKNKVRRNDFLDVLIQLNKDDSGVTTDEMAVQLFAMFVAGCETTAFSLSFCLFELAKNQEIQQKLRKEIQDSLNKNGGKFVFDEMAGMDYTRKVIFETLRKYPVLVNVYRKSKEDYPLPDGIRRIEKDTTIIIPLHAFHHDPEIYEDPETFNPERFTPEEMANRHPCSFLPFFDGPRNCAGSSFAKMMLYVGLVSLVSKFQFSFSASTQDPVPIDLTSSKYLPRDGIYLKVNKL